MDIRLFWLVVHCTTSVFAWGNPEALKLMKEAIELDNNGKFDESIIKFQKAASLTPPHARHYNNLGVSLMRKGHRDGRLTDYLRSQNAFIKSLELDIRDKTAIENAEILDGILVEHFPEHCKGRKPFCFDFPIIYLDSLEQKKKSTRSADNPQVNNQKQKEPKKTKTKTKTTDKTKRVHPSHFVSEKEDDDSGFYNYDYYDYDDDEVSCSEPSTTTTTTTTTTSRTKNQEDIIALRKYIQELEKLAMQNGVKKSSIRKLRLQHSLD